MLSFESVIEIIGINPHVIPPADILGELFETAGRSKGKIQVRMRVDKGSFFPQTLVKYAGEWRLYLNGPMREEAGKDVGDPVFIEMEFDPSDRALIPHPRLAEALRLNSGANEVFESLSPSLQQEIIRYISRLKSEESIDRNVDRAIRFLLGKERFIGRDQPK